MPQCGRPQCGGHRGAAAAATLMALIAAAATAEDDRHATLVSVNGHTITQTDLESAYLVRGVSPENRGTLRTRLLERLIDETLVASFLQHQGVQPNPALLQTHVDQLMALIRRRGEDPDALLARLGLDRQKIEKQLSLPLAWELYAREVITAEQLHSWFEAHRRELDGTQVRARHIVLIIPEAAAESDWERATQNLAVVREEILQKRRSFEQAAREVSEGPSGKQGGDVGYLTYHGVMPPAFARAAFGLKPGEVSPPVRTTAGVHLIEVTEERPGQLSLEDVREQVFQQLSADLWDRQVQKERSRARIQWTDAADATSGR